MNTTKKILIGVIVTCVALSVFSLWSFLHKPRFDSPIIDIHGPTPSVTSSPTATRTPTPSVSVKPSETPAVSGRKVIDVPFTVQAPYGNWDHLHQEMCEEGTLVMAHAWKNNIDLTPAYAEQQLQRLAKWGVDNFGTYVDTSARQTAQMGEIVYGLKTKIIDEPSVADIKAEIDAGNIVIMGMAGRMLGNPNYTPPGPLYHMLLIKGYDATGFITNDDGTRRGNSYHYSYDTIMNASRDWIEDGGSLMDNPSVAFSVSKQ